MPANGKKVAILVATYFEQAELTSPRQALQDAGYTVEILSPVEGTLQGMHGDVDKADTFTADNGLEGAEAADYAAVVVPGGTVNADTLRQNETAQQFVTHSLKGGKPTAVICHGPWLLVSAGLVKERTLTSFPSLAVDIRNAGGNWVDQEVAEDANLITSRNPNDLPAFNRTLLAALER